MRAPAHRSVRLARFACFASALVALAPACGGNGTAPLPPASYVLGDGTAVQVDGHGALTISDGDRVLLSTAAGKSPIGRTYDETSEMTLGGFTFRRTHVVERPLDTFTGSQMTDAGVVLSFTGDSGATATETISTVTPNVATRVRLEVSGIDGLGSTAIPLGCDADATFMGFGAQYDTTEHRGDAFPLWVSEQGIGRTGGANPLPWVGNTHTTYFPAPYWMDARGFGVLVQTSARVLVDLCKTDANTAWVEVEDAQPVDLVVLHGPTPRDVVRELGDIEGRPKAPPTWAWRPWIAVQGGKDAVLQTADALDAAGVPYGALWVQDWTGTRQFAMSLFGVAYQWVADDTLYPDLAGMIDTLHMRGVRFLGYANPFVIPGLAHYDAMNAMGLLIGAPDGSGSYLFPGLEGDTSMPDFTNPAAVTYVEGYLRAMATDLGMDGWMSDYGEWLPTDAVLSDGSDAHLYHNRYATAWHQVSRDVLDAAHPDGDYVLFSRSGWNGEQGVAQIVWIGDQEASFSPTDGLPTVVPAVLSLGLTAVPYVTFDLGGYSGGPRTKEAFERWTELAAFTPVMRTHEGLMRTANWQWNTDADTTTFFRRFARIHEALRPTFEALATEAAQTSMPMLRHLVLEFPNDPSCREVSDEMMLGDDLLIAPVTVEGATSRQVYLPPGTWYHVWSGMRYDGGRTITVDAPLGSPPVFSRNTDRPDLRAIE